VKASVSAQTVLAGDRRAIARALTEVENDSSLGSDLLDELFVHTGKAHLVGVTGSPGAGKSSLVNQIAKIFRKPKSGQPVRVGIVAVDPSSPFTGGAILGDRVRMRDLSGDSGVFIRSMATRGTLGGLAKKTSAFAQILDAAGYELILIETVGAGQSEVDIARLAHTTIVVESPGMGDDIQAIKAGILEIADILVVNKADHPMADLTIRALKANLELARPQQFSSFERMHLHTLAFDPVSIVSSDVADIWYPPLFSTISTKGEGIDPLVEAIVAHKAYLQDNGQWRQREAARLQEELNDLLLGYFAYQWRMHVDKSKIEEVVHDLITRKYSPQQSLKRLI
jgi:LAO/AO transport system kinase